MAPRLPSRKPGPAVPVSWFQIIVPDTAPTPNQSVEALGEDDAEGVRRPIFASVDVLADRERERKRAGEPEPADVVLRRADAAAEARRIIAEAKETALAILAESREQGYAEGYAAGYAAGEIEATRHLTQRADDDRKTNLADLAAFMVSIEETSRSAWLAMEPEIIGLVFEIARKVIKMEVDINRQPAIEIVKNTLRRVADSTALRIRVHADDLQSVRAHREELYGLVDTIRSVEIVEDRRVGLGGCILETNAGTIDARIETQLDEVRKLLAA